MTSMGEMFPARMHTPLFPFRTALTTSFTPRFIAFFFAAFFTSCATPRPEPPRRQPPAGDDARGLAALGVGGGGKRETRNGEGGGVREGADTLPGRRLGPPPPDPQRPSRHPSGGAGGGRARTL